MRRRFSKGFLTAEFRADHAAKWAAAWATVKGPPSELCARVLLDVYRALYPQTWNNGARARGIVHAGPALQVLAETKIRRLPDSAVNALLRWSKNEIDLELFDRVPNPFEVLKAQAEGRRCVSLLIQEEEIQNFAMDGREFCSFLIHDLEHAELLTKDATAFANQTKFARLLLERWQSLNAGLESTARLELEYMASDMNSHIVHLLKTLKSWSQRHGREIPALPEAIAPLWPELNTAGENRERLFERWNSISSRNF